MTGLPIGKLGNAILRSHIASVHLEELLGKKLVESGRVDREEYQEILEGALRELRDAFTPGHAPVEITASGDMVSGSWEIQSLLRPSDGGFQILECWARDALQRPMAQHSHDADEYAIMLGGRSHWVISGTPIVLQKGNVLQIPAEAVHACLPLDRECHMLVVTVPATPEYSTARE